MVLLEIINDLLDRSTKYSLFKFYDKLYVNGEFKVPDHINIYVAERSRYDFSMSYREDLEHKYKYPDLILIHKVYTGSTGINDWQYCFTVNKYGKKRVIDIEYIQRLLTFINIANESELKVFIEFRKDSLEVFNSPRFGEYRVSQTGLTRIQYT